MSTLQILKERSGNCCELCGATENLDAFLVPPKSDESGNHCALICGKCKADIENPEQADTNHWRCLNDSMWNDNSAVKVLAYRMLHHLRAEGWPQDLLDMIYLEEDDLKWAQSTLLAEGEKAIIHRDCNGVKLENGDTVVLTKDLDVKGTSFVAKRGTAVRNISLVADDETHIEGRVNGQMIYIVTKYLKKS